MKKVLYLILLFSFLAIIGNLEAQNQVATNQNSATPKVNLQAKKIEAPQPGEFMNLVEPKRAPKLFNLASRFVKKVPVIDGSSHDRVWQNVPSITILDYASQRPITVKSSHTKDQIFLLVQFPDAAPSITHKSLGWDYGEEVYKQLNDREDVCIIKWSMVGNNVPLSLKNAESHKADIWFWKAMRTNPTGYVDDKYELLEKTKSEQSNPIPSQNNGTLYLQRIPDEGDAAFKEQLVFKYQGDVISQYLYQTPTGSRADVKAKGYWDNGFWTIEFARKLNTGYKDDVSFKQGKTYLFGISLYEITGVGIDPELSQPLYKVGDIYDHVLLTIK